MFCTSCGEQIKSRSKICPNCGKKQKKLKVIPLLFLMSFISFIVIGTTLFLYFDQSKQSIPVSKAPSERTNNMETTEDVEKHRKIEDDKEKSEAIMEVIPEAIALPAEEIKEEVKKDITAVIAESQSRVLTIYTGTTQGSGFLMNQNGDIVTNAHVVEGYVSVSVTDSNGVDYDGQVVGYSNDTDIAVIHVPELSGRQSIELETSEYTIIGEEVIALGSPQGLENTATLGYITGVNRSFNIGQRSYKNLYQMSAPISPGSSGGPLLSKETGKVIAINSAKMLGEEAIGFSIPIIDIYPLLQGWIQQPLTKQEVINLFYNDNGNYYYEDLWENEEEWYFDDGDYQEEDADTYYDIPDEWVDEPYDKAYKDGMYEEAFEKDTQEDVDSSMEEDVPLEPIPEEYEDNETIDETPPDVQEEIVESDEKSWAEEETNKPSVAQ
jgi:serine protease Do